MNEFDSSSALGELELGAFAAPTGFARSAKQSPHAINDHQIRAPGALVSRVPPP